MTDAKKRKAVIYCRVSSKTQELEGHGLGSQETRCRQYADAKDYDVVAVFPDTVSGGGDFMKRPGMVALISFLDAQPSECFVVIFDDLKRYARDVEFHLKLRREMEARGAIRECLNFNFMDSPEGKFQEIIIAASGQLEREQNQRQVSQKMAARMQNGYWVHAVPAGYKYIREKGRGSLVVPDEPLATIVRDAFEGYATGRFGTQAEIQRYFASFPVFPRNKHGEVTRQRVKDILINPLYTGHIVSERYGIHWLKGHHDALISMDTFERVQARLKGIAKAPRRKNVGDDFALRGFVCCADCGTPYRSSWSTGHSKRYAYYLCQTKTCASYGKSIGREKLEGDIGELVKTLQPTEKLLEITKAMFRHAWDQRIVQAQDVIRSGHQQIKAVEKQIDSLLARILDATNATVIGTYEHKISDLERKKAILASQLENQAEPKGSYEEKLEPVLTFLANPWKLWQTGNVALRRTVLKLAFADRLYYHRIEGPRTPEIALPFKVLGGLNGGKVCFGAAEGTRTPDPIITNDVLYQLSYSGLV